MRLTFLLSIASILFSLCAWTGQKPSFNVYVTGRIYQENGKQDRNLPGLRIFVKYKGEILQTDTTDSMGKYSLEFLVGHLDSATYDFYVTGNGMDNCLIKCVRQFEGEEVEWNIVLPNPPAKRSGMIICPKCQKSDKVYPIEYPAKGSGHTSQGKVVQTRYQETHFTKTSLSPRYYCDRDKVKF